MSANYRWDGRLDHLFATSSGPESECWRWRGYINVHGYGVFSGQLAHRISYEKSVGPIPDGLYIDHLCRNRACVNPAHLEPVTRKENILRGIAPSAVAARQTHCIAGHPFDGENLYITSKGERQCRECKKRRRREFKERTGR